MKKIYKYGPLYFTDIQFKGIPKLVGIQNNMVYVWCLVDDNPAEGLIRLFPTGVDFNGEHVGSVIDESEHVWHAVVSEL